MSLLLLGRRFAVAVVVDALSGGLLRPFLIVYGVVVLHLPVVAAGASLTSGLLLGLVGIVLIGRWIDVRGPRAPLTATMLARATGVAVLVIVGNQVGFVVAAILLGLGNGGFRTSYAAMVAALAARNARSQRDVDLALGAGRALANAGTGTGALLAAGALTAGVGGLRGLAVGTAVGYVSAAALIATLRVDRRPTGPGAGDSTPIGTGPVRGLRRLTVLNLPYALHFDVLEVALPAVLVTSVSASPAWSGVIFIGNTLMVVALQVPLIRRLGRWSRRTVLSVSGLVLAGSYLGFLAAGTLSGQAGGAAIALVAIIYTLGEITYTGSGTALVLASTPADRHGRALARWELSTGLGKAVAPAVLTGLLAIDPLAMWGTLALTTAAAAIGVGSLSIEGSGGRPEIHSTPVLVGGDSDAQNVHFGLRARRRPLRLR